MNTKNSQVIFSSKTRFTINFAMYTILKINNLYEWLPAVTSTISHYSVSSFSCGGCTCFCTMQERATDSNNFSISGAQCTNS